jgi:NAD(P)-dependent dehydrogenase (short-subunit alcohol dehydrogenase family)
LELGKCLREFVVVFVSACNRLQKVNKSDMPEAAHTNALRILAALELNRRLAGSGVDVFCCHPGVTKTEVTAVTMRGLAR